MLVDSSSTHKTPSAPFVAKKSLLKNSAHAFREISGFYGLTETSNHSINLRIDDANQTSLFADGRLV